MKLVLAAVALLAAPPAFAQDAATHKTPSGEAYLQTSSGQALYVFDGDRTPGGTPGAPTCEGQCAKAWPPFIAGADAKTSGDWTVVDRKDGIKQWAYKKRPVYTFVRDQTSGKIEGDGFDGNKWHLAQP